MSMDIGVEEQRTAIEVIATLVNVRQAMVNLILKPAGVPPEIYQPVLLQCDESTGERLSKRQMAPLILDAVAKRPDGGATVRAIIEIAASWTSFHLAHDEYAARATVQKAAEILRQIETEESRRAEQRKREEQERQREEAAESERHRDLLLAMFDELARSDDHQRRGYLLQELLRATFDLFEITLVRPFTRNQGAEQIDGAFKLEGWHYLVECRWREKLADIRELDGLKGQVDRSGKQTMGFFLSINGWSDNVPLLLKQNPEKSIVLMEGYDLRTTLCGTIDLREFILAKVEKLNLDGRAFYGAVEYLAARAN